MKYDFITTLLIEEKFYVFIIRLHHYSLIKIMLCLMVIQIFIIDVELYYSSNFHQIWKEYYYFELYFQRKDFHINSKIINSLLTFFTLISILIAILIVISYFFNYYLFFVKPNFL